MSDKGYVHQSTTSSAIDVLHTRALATQKVNSERRKSIEQILNTLNKTTITESELGNLYKHKRTSKRRSSAVNHSYTLVGLKQQQKEEEKQQQQRRKSLPVALEPLPIQFGSKHIDANSFDGTSIDGDLPLSARVQLSPVKRNSNGSNIYSTHNESSTRRDSVLSFVVDEFVESDYDGEPGERTNKDFVLSSLSNVNFNNGITSRTGVQINPDSVLLSSSTKNLNSEATSWTGIRTRRDSILSSCVDEIIDLDYVDIEFEPQASESLLLPHKKKSVSTPSGIPRVDKKAPTKIVEFKLGPQGWPARQRYRWTMAMFMLHSARVMNERLKVGKQKRIQRARLTAMNLLETRETAAKKIQRRFRLIKLVGQVQPILKRSWWKVQLRLKARLRRLAERSIRDFVVSMERIEHSSPAHSFGFLVKRFRFSVVRLQRWVRGFIASRKCRRQVLHRLCAVVIKEQVGNGNWGNVLKPLRVKADRIQMQRQTTSKMTEKVFRELGDSHTYISGRRFSMVELGSAVDESRRWLENLASKHQTITHHGYNSNKRKNGSKTPYNPLPKSTKTQPLSSKANKPLRSVSSSSSPPKLPKLFNRWRERLSGDAVHNGAIQHDMLVRELDALLKQRRKAWGTQASIHYQATKLSVMVDTGDVRKIISGDCDMNELLKCKQNHRHVWPLFLMLTHKSENVKPLRQAMEEIALRCAEASWERIVTGWCKHRDLEMSLESNEEGIHGGRSISDASTGMSMGVNGMTRAHVVLQATRAVRARNARRYSAGSS